MLGPKTSGLWWQFYIASHLLAAAAGYGWLCFIVSKMKGRLSSTAFDWSFLNAKNPNASFLANQGLSQLLERLHLVSPPPRQEKISHSGGFFCVLLTLFLACYFFI